MTNRTRTMTLTVTLNPNGTLAMDATNQGMPLNRVGEGMFRSLEAQILGEFARKMNAEDTPEMRTALASHIREATQRILDASPTVDKVEPGMMMVIPGGMEVSDGEA